MKIHYLIQWLHEIGEKMFEIKWETKVERNEEGIKNALSNILEKMVYQNGCTKCQGKNLTVYVNAINRNSIDGYFYCHDCNTKGNVSVDHDFYDKMDEIEKKFQDMFRK